MMRPPVTWRVPDEALDQGPVVTIDERALRRALAHEQQWRGRPEHEIRAAQEAALQRRFARTAP